MKIYEESPKTFLKRDDSKPSTRNELIDATFTSVHKDVEKILYSRRFGLGKYEIVIDSEETLVGWQQEIQNIRSALSAGDKSIVETLMSRDGKIRGDVNTVMKILEAGNWDEQSLTLLAIGLWVLRDKSRWKGAFHAGRKMLIGGRFNISSFLQKEGNATCLDTCILFNELAKLFGIAGAIYVTDNHRFGHRIWKSESGETIDISYAWRRGEFFKNEAEFHEYVKNNKELDWYLRKPKKYVLEQF